MADGDQQHALSGAPPSFSSPRPTTAPQPTSTSPGNGHSPQSLAMASAAMQNNDRLFPQMLAKLSDAQTYLEEAQKLRLWMSNQRAYYARARPWILKLLERAQQTVMALGGGDFSQGFHMSRCLPSPYLPAYVDLIETLAAFRRHFPQELLANVDVLIATVRPLPPGIAARMQPTPLTIPHSTQSASASTSGITSHFFTQPSAPRSAGVGPSYSRDYAQVGPSSAPPTVPPAVPFNVAPQVTWEVLNQPRVSSSISLTTQPRTETSQASASAPVQARPSATPQDAPPAHVSAAPASSIVPPVGTAQSSSAPPLVPKKRVKAKAKLSVDFLEADLHWYLEHKEPKEKEGSAQPKVEVESVLAGVAESEAAPAAFPEIVSAVEKGPDTVIKGVEDQMSHMKVDGARASLDEQPPADAGDARPELGTDPVAAVVVDERTTSPDAAPSSEADRSNDTKSVQPDALTDEPIALEETLHPTATSESVENPAYQESSGHLNVDQEVPQEQNEWATEAQANTEPSISLLPPFTPTSQPHPLPADSPSTSTPNRTAFSPHKPIPTIDIAAQSAKREMLRRSAKKKGRSHPEFRFQPVRSVSKPSTPVPAGIASRSVSESAVATSQSPAPDFLSSTPLTAGASDTPSFIAPAPPTPPPAQPPVTITEKELESHADAVPDKTMSPEPSMPDKVAEDSIEQDGPAAAAASDSTHQKPVSSGTEKLGRKPRSKGKGRKGPPGIRVTSTHSLAAEDEVSTYVPPLPRAPPVMHPVDELPPSVSRKGRSRVDVTAIEASGNTMEDVGPSPVEMELVDTGTAHFESVEEMVDVEPSLSPSIAPMENAKRKERPDEHEGDEARAFKKAKGPEVVAEEEEEMEEEAAQGLNEPKSGPNISTEAVNTLAVAEQVGQPTEVEPTQDVLPLVQEPPLSPRELDEVHEPTPQLPAEQQAAAQAAKEMHSPVADQAESPQAILVEGRDQPLVEETQPATSAQAIDVDVEAGRMEAMNVDQLEAPIPTQVDHEPMVALPLTSAQPTSLETAESAPVAEGGDVDAFAAGASPEAAGEEEESMEVDAVDAQLVPSSVSSTRSALPPSPHVPVDPVVLSSPRTYMVESFADGNFAYPDTAEPTASLHITTIPADEEAAPGAEEDRLTPIMPSMMALADEAQSAEREQKPNPEVVLQLVNSWMETLDQVSDNEEQRIAGLPALSEEDLTPYFAEDTSILAFVQGGISFADPVEMLFAVTEEQMEGLRVWAQKTYDPQIDITASKCLSLCCFRYDRCLGRLDREAEIQPASLFRIKPDVWPWQMRPWAELNEHRQLPIIGLVVTNDQLFDISRYVQVGTNTIRMHYPYGKPSEWVFAVLLHSPTPAQLAVLERRRTSAREWKKTLDGLQTVRVPPIKWPDLPQPVFASRT